MRLCLAVLAFTAVPALADDIATSMDKTTDNIERLAEALDTWGAEIDRLNDTLRRTNENLRTTIQQPPNVMPIPAPCGPREVVEGHLAGKYGESPVIAGHNPQGWPLVVTANPATGTYTVILRRPDGMTCMIGGGTGFTLIEAKPVIQGKDS